MNMFIVKGMLSSLLITRGYGSAAPPISLRPGNIVSVVLATDIFTGPHSSVVLATDIFTGPHRSVTIP